MLNIRVIKYLKSLTLCYIVACISFLAFSAEKNAIDFKYLFTCWEDTGFVFFKWNFLQLCYAGNGYDSPDITGCFEAWFYVFTKGTFTDI